MKKGVLLNDTPLPPNWEDMEEELEFNEEYQKILNKMLREYEEKENIEFEEKLNPNSLINKEEIEEYKALESIGNEISTDGLNRDTINKNKKLKKLNETEKVYTLNTPNNEVLNQYKQQVIDNFNNGYSNKIYTSFMEYINIKYLIIGIQSNGLIDEEFYHYKLILNSQLFINKYDNDNEIKCYISQDQYKEINLIEEFNKILPNAYLNKDKFKKAIDGNIKLNTLRFNYLNKEASLSENQKESIINEIDFYNDKIKSLNDKSNSINEPGILKDTSTGDISTPYKLNKYCTINKIKSNSKIYFRLIYNNYENYYTNLGTLLTDVSIFDTSISINQSMIEEFLNNTNYINSTLNITTDTPIKCRIEELRKSFKEYTKRINILERELGTLFIDLFQVVEDQENEKYYLNKKTNSYNLLTNKDKKDFLNKLFENKKVTTLKQLNKGLEYTNNKTIQPTPNIIKFNNCLFSMDTFKIVNNDTPIIPSLEVNYNFIENTNVNNPNYKIANTYLNDVFGEDKESYLEVLGYLFVTGNPKEVGIIKTGLGGTGKTTSFKIEKSIFPSSEKQFKQLNNRFGKSNIKNKKLIIVPNADNDNARELKSLISGEAQYIEAKGKDQIQINDNKSIVYEIVCNNIPNISIDKTMQDKLLIFHFKNRIRYTNKDLKNGNKKYSDIFINNIDCMEYLISNAIKQYKQMVENNNTFKILSKNMDYLKSNSITNALSNALINIIEVDKSINENAPNNIIVTTQELEKCIKQYAVENSINIKTTPKGKIKGLNKELMEIIGVDTYKAINKPGLNNQRFYPKIKYKTIKNNDGKIITTKDYYLK